MITYYLRLVLESDATFGRGDGVAGLVDEEIEYDPATGLPFLRGRTLKGLLTEECANLLYAATNAPKLSDLQEAAKALFGGGGSTTSDDAQMKIGHAELPQALRDAVRADVDRRAILPSDVLESLTAIRRQTAMTPEGVPEDGSLRSMRVLLRGTELIAPLFFDTQPSPVMLALLGACAVGLRRAGTGRNRGRGKLTASLVDQDASSDLTETQLEYFERILKGAHP
ncbi:hypothetical protein ANRL4_03456 [Anaerolineae bacterium]|nr:hypothetical protein ANRL4_03456 [Anaerolineae bacterium]